ncbi:MAG: hypothetical protein Phog2KO_49860 [Phototrophicaceae bacterium]
MYEKRKNSDKRSGISFGLAVLLMLGGLFAGMQINGSSSDSSDAVEAPVTDLEFIETVDLSGEWIGTTTQDYNDNDRYDYRIVIEQDGTDIEGMSYLDMIDSDVYAEERIEGTINYNTVVYSEVETLVLDSASLDSWCLTETTLTYQILNGQETLVGEWNYVLGERASCEGISGRVILTRQED